MKASNAVIRAMHGSNVRLEEKVMSEDPLEFG